MGRKVKFPRNSTKERIMAGKGSKDKGSKEQKKKPKHNLKEKRKLKQEKQQNKSPFAPG
jgi:hypothetical protein